MMRNSDIKYDYDQILLLFWEHLAFCSSILLSFPTSFKAPKHIIFVFSVADVLFATGRMHNNIHLLSSK